MWTAKDSACIWRACSRYACWLAVTGPQPVGRDDAPAATPSPSLSSSGRCRARRRRYRPGAGAGRGRRAAAAASAALDLAELLLLGAVGRVVLEVLRTGPVLLALVRRVGLAPGRLILGSLGGHGLDVPAPR